MNMRSWERNRGFTLTEVAISFAIIAFILVFFLGSGTAFLELRKTEATRTKLAAIERALTGFISIHGRLPCPADGSLPTDNVNAGKEDGGAGGCNALQINGVVPWATIGMTEADILDSWYARITYRLGNNLWVASGMDMTACDTAGTEIVAPPGACPDAVATLCNTACSSSTLNLCTKPRDFLRAGKGLSIQNTSVAGTELMDACPALLTSPSEGAAFVLISHGPNLAGAFLANGGAVTATTGTGTDEIHNANGVAVKNFYVDKDWNETQGVTHFDDLLLRPSIMKVIMQAQRGPRAH